MSLLRQLKSYARSLLDLGEPAASRGAPAESPIARHLAFTPFAARRDRQGDNAAKLTEPTTGGQKVNGLRRVGSWQVPETPLGPAAQDMTPDGPTAMEMSVAPTGRGTKRKGEEVREPEGEQTGPQQAPETVRKRQAVASGGLSPFVKSSQSAQDLASPMQLMTPLMKVQSASRLSLVAPPSRRRSAARGVTKRRGRLPMALKPKPTGQKDSSLPLWVRTRPGRTQVRRLTAQGRGSNHRGPLAILPAAASGGGPKATDGEGQPGGDAGDDEEEAEFVLWFPDEAPKPPAPAPVPAKTVTFADPPVSEAAKPSSSDSQGKEAKGAATALFTFGSSQAAASDSSAPAASSAALGSLFTFGSSSAAAATNSGSSASTAPASASAGVFAFGASSAPASGASTAAANPTPATFTFGASSAAAPAASSGTAGGIFTFGASSAAGAAFSFGGTSAPGGPAAPAPFSFGAGAAAAPGQPQTAAPSFAFGGGAAGGGAAAPSFTGQPAPVAAGGMTFSAVGAQAMGAPGFAMGSTATGAGGGGTGAARRTLKARRRAR